jgi:PAS domain S-box-containing protein
VTGKAGGLVSRETVDTASRDSVDMASCDSVEPFFQSLVECIPQMVWTKDANGVNDYCNRRFIEYMNVTKDEFVHNSWAVAHPDDIARGQEAWRLAVAAGTPYESEIRLRPKDAHTYRWFLVRAVPHRDAAGRVDKWFGTTTDIDAQRRALEAMDFLSQSGATISGAEDVPQVLERLAHASLEDLADISIFDLENEDGTFRRLVMGSPHVSSAAVRVTEAFDPPRAGEPHPIARVMDDGHTIHIPHVDEDFILRSITPKERQDAWRFVAIQSLVSAPMTVPGRVRGALTLLRTRSGVPFEPSEVRAIEEVARRAAGAIDNIRFHQREQRAANDLRAFADMGESISESVGLQDTLDAAIHVIVPSRADWAFITLLDERGDLRLAAVYHPDDAKRRVVAARIGDVYRPAESTAGIASEVVRTKSPVYREGIAYADAANFVNLPVLDALWSAGVASFVVVPLFAGSAVRGTVHLCMQNDVRAFVPADVDFFQEFARRLAPAIANAEVFERERRVARSFQDAALPSRLPEVPGFAFHAIYEAGRAEALVGGDWYDAFTLASGQIVVSIGDVAGSGLPAAVTMAGVRQAIRGAAHAAADPSGMLDAADRALDDPERRFVTAFVGVIDPATSTIAYQNAGHPPPLLRMPDGTVRELPGGGAPLGLRGNEQPGAHAHALPTGSLLALYTDGLTESTHDVLEGERRLRAALLHSALDEVENPAKTLYDSILVDGSRDDVAILTVAIR